MLTTLTPPPHRQAAVAQRPQAAPPVADCVGFHPMQLLQIFTPEQQICVADRPQQPAIIDYLSQYATSIAPGQRLLLDMSQAIAQQLRQQLRLPAGHGRDALLADMAYLATLYADLLDCPHIGVRLEVTSHAMCPKFHIDRTGIRLLCTYVGPGTEWLEEGSCNRAALSLTHANLDDFHQALILHPQGIRQATSHALVLLKGSRWQGNELAGAVHRSPHVPPSVTRTVLALDAIW